MRKKAFTLVEILVVMAIVSILAVITIAVLNPLYRIDKAKDDVRLQDVETILESITNYVVDHEGALPTYDPGSGSTALPTVTADNVLANGIPATQLEGIAPAYVGEIPVDPNGIEYRVGVAITSAAIVGVMLSDGTVFTLSR